MRIGPARTRPAGATEIVLGSTRIGGLPDLPPDEPWPEHAGRPLAFIAQLRLVELSKLVALEQLPESGYLFFFYDAKEQPWGYSAKDRGSWRVINHQTGRVTARPRR